MHFIYLQIKINKYLIVFSANIHTHTHTHTHTHVYVNIHALNLFFKLEIASKFHK